MIKPPIKNAKIVITAVPAVPATPPTEVKIPDPTVVPTPSTIADINPKRLVSSFSPPCT